MSSLLSTINFPSESGKILQEFLNVNMHIHEGTLNPYQNMGLENWCKESEKVGREVSVRSGSCPCCE